ncbi:MAG TPA: hypothetical protein VGP25_18655 [Gemmatimonadaceae bacterium]|jgi:hypothetical protein|nr:hypothetical protein [Gemmatimonadaceae bacterium]
MLRAGLLLAIAALPAAFSAWIDPGRLVPIRTQEAAMARALASGHNVTDLGNFNDRAIERSLAALRTGRADVLTLGSSRMQPMPVSAFPGKVFINGAMQGGILDDMIAVYGLYDTDARRPKRVVVNVDPWTESFDGMASWSALADERTAVMRKAGIAVSPLRERAAIAVKAAKQLAAPEYFRLAVFSFRHYGPRGIMWRTTDSTQNTEKTKLPNGTVVWQVVSEDSALARAQRFSRYDIRVDPRFQKLDARLPGRAGALEKFVRYMRSEGVEVTVLLVPFPTEMYDAFVALPGYSVRTVESELGRMAARTGASVAGSYDPRPLGITSRDFFDEDHLRPDPLARLVASR